MAWVRVYCYQRDPLLLVLRMRREHRAGGSRVRGAAVVAQRVSRAGGVALFEEVL